MKRRSGDLAKGVGLILVLKTIILFMLLNKNIRSFLPDVLLSRQLVFGNGLREETIKCCLILNCFNYSFGAVVRLFIWDRSIKTLEYMSVCHN